MTLLDDLKAKRTELRTAADELLTRAATDERDLTPDELRAHQDRTGELREVDDRIEQLRDDEVRELRAASARATSGANPHALGELLTRAISGGDGAAGSAFTPGEFPATFFDRLAAQSVGLASGFSVITTTRDTLTVPVVAADNTAAWTSEGATITPSDMDADPLVATPRKLAALQVVSNEALADSSPSLMERIGASLVRSIGLRGDLGFYEGTGAAPQIRGLSNVAGIAEVTSLGANGAVPTDLDEVADAVAAVEGADARATAIVMHPRTWQTFAKIKAETGSNLPLLTADSNPTGAARRSIFGIPVYLSSQLSITETRGTSNDTSSVYVYDAAEVVVVRREDVSVEVDRSRLFNSDQSEIRAIARMDLVVPHPAAVARIVGVKA